MGAKASRAAVAGAGLAAVAGTGDSSDYNECMMPAPQLAIAPPPDRLMIAPPPDYDRAPFPGETAPRPGAVVSYDAARAGSLVDPTEGQSYMLQTEPEPVPFGGADYFAEPSRQLTPQTLSSLEDPEAERRRRALMTARQRKRAGRAERGLPTRGSGGGGDVVAGGGGAANSAALIVGLLLLVAVGFGLYFGIKDLTDASKTNKTVPWILTIASGLVGLGVLGSALRGATRRPTDPAMV